MCKETHHYHPHHHPKTMVESHFFLFGRRFGASLYAMVFDFPEESRIQTIRGEMMNSNIGESIMPSINGESIIQSIKGESLDFIDDLSLRRSLSRKLSKVDQVKNNNIIKSKFDNKETLSNKFDDRKGYRSKSDSPVKNDAGKLSSSKFALQLVNVYEDVKQGSSIISPLKSSKRGSKADSAGKYDIIKTGSILQSKAKYENIQTGSVLQSSMKSKAVYENIKTNSKTSGSQFLGSQIVLKTKQVSNEESKQVLQEKLTHESKKLYYANNPLSTTKSHKEEDIHTEEKKSRVSTKLSPDEDKATQKSNRSEEEKKVLKPAQEKKYELGDKMAIESKSREMIFQEVTKGLYIDEMFHSNKHFLKDKISNVLNERKEVKKFGYSYLRKLDNMLLFLKEVSN